MNDINQGKSKILIVDDEEAIRFFLAERLIEEGWLVTETDSGEAALVTLADRSYDVILLDLRMPGIDGLTVMHEVKAQWPDTMIIIMTGYASIESAIEAVRHGAFDYLRKPCDTSEVIDCVNRALLEKRAHDRQREITRMIENDSIGESSPSMAMSRVVNTGSLTINLDSRKIHSSGEHLAVTPTEYELLALLADSIGKPVSIDQLIEGGLGYDPKDPQAQETLRVHISRLRNKIGSSYILTIRGGGYILVELPPADTFS